MGTVAVSRAWLTGLTIKKIHFLGSDNNIRVITTFFQMFFGKISIKILKASIKGTTENVLLVKQQDNKLSKRYSRVNDASIYNFMSQVLLQ